MSRQIGLILASVIAGVVTGYYSTNLDLKVAAEKAPVVLAVFMAALFVRLARGVPSFPFDKIPQRTAEYVLTALVHLRAMYALAFASFMTALIVSIAYTPLMNSTESHLIEAILSGLLTAALVWAVATAYLVYRTDMALFKAQTAAVQKVVDVTASESASSSIETVRKNLITSGLPKTE